MEAAKQQASKILTALGCAVGEIPECEERRADLRAIDMSSTYIVEVKEKFDDKNALKAESRQLADGKVVSKFESLSHHNRLDAIFKDGRDQLDKTPKSNDDIRVLWLSAGGIDRQVCWKRAFATFYGFVQLFPLKPPSDKIESCFYFDYSAAWSMPSIDAMMLVDCDNLQMCLNEFSPRFHAIRESNLCKKLSDAVVDPIKLESANSIIALHSDVSRKNEELVLKELYSQTGIRYTTLRPKQHSASTLTKRDDAV